MFECRDQSQCETVKIVSLQGYIGVLWVIEFMTTILRKLRDCGVCVLSFWKKTAKEYSIKITHLEIGFHDSKNWASWRTKKGKGDKISLFVQYVALMTWQYEIWWLFVENVKTKIKSSRKNDATNGKKLANIKELQAKMGYWRKNLIIMVATFARDEI